MDREYVLFWLRHRLSASRNGKVVHFDHIDIDFIRRYIKHYKNTDVSQKEISNSIVHKLPPQMLYHLDFMMNKLVQDFSINIETKDHHIVNYY